MSATPTRWRYAGPYTPKPFLVPLTGTWCRHPDAKGDTPDHVETTDERATAQLEASPHWQRMKRATKKKTTKTDQVSAPTIIQED